MIIDKNKAIAFMSLGLLFLVDVVYAESSLVGNIGVTTNYVWRGISQSDDHAAVSSGIDYNHPSGWYAGGWTSSLDGSDSENSYELDLYVGYRFKAGSTDLDMGYIDYRYPIGSAPNDFGEVYLNASFDNYAAGVAYSVRTEHNPANEDNLYTFISADFEVKKDLYLDLLVGGYDFDDPARTNYTHRAIGLRKGNFSITFHKNTLSGIAGDTRWSGSWKKEFDL